MMLPSSPVQVYLAAGVTDMRKSINGLSILVEEQLDLDPLSDPLSGSMSMAVNGVKSLLDSFCGLQ